MECQSGKRCNNVETTENHRKESGPIGARAVLQDLYKLATGYELSYATERWKKKCGGSCGRSLWFNVCILEVTVITLRNRQIIGVPQGKVAQWYQTLDRLCAKCGKGFQCIYMGCSSYKEQTCVCGICLGATVESTKGCCDLRFKKVVATA
jgi:hypothetical protein